MKQIVHGELDVDMFSVFLQKSRIFGKTAAFLLKLVRLEKQDGLRKGNIQGIHHNDFSVGIFLHQLLRRDADIVVAAAQGGGEGDMQDVEAFLQDALKAFPDYGRIVRHGGGQGAFPHLLIKFGGRHVLLIPVNLVSEGIILGNDHRLIFFGKKRRQIGIGIDGNTIVLHNFSLSSFIIGLAFMDGSKRRFPVKTGVSKQADYKLLQGKCQRCGNRS